MLRLVLVVVVLLSVMLYVFEFFEVFFFKTVMLFTFYTIIVVTYLVIMDLIIYIFSLIGSFFIYELDPSKWHRIEKDLYLRSRLHGCM